MLAVVMVYLGLIVAFLGGLSVLRPLSFQNIVRQLKKERLHVQQQLQRKAEALAALGGNANGTRTMSTAGRRRISLAQKARWAKHKAKPKRTMSVAVRKKIAAAQRARWAKVKSAA